MNKKFLFFIAKFIVYALLIWFFATNLDIGSAGARLKKLQVGYLLVAFVLFSALLINNTMRWRIVLAAIHANLPFAAAVKILYIADFFNQLLPSAIGGDAFRMFLSRRGGVSLRGAVNGVMLERVTTVIGLIILVVITQPFLLARIGDNPVKYIFPLLAVLAVLGIVFLMLMDRSPKRFQNLSVVRGLGYLAADARKLFLSPGPAIRAITLGISGNILIALMAYMTARALVIDVSVLDCLVLIPPVILIMTLPISIAGWGVREGAMVTAFAFVGVTGGDAFVMSLLFGVVNIVFALPGGVLWLLGDYKREEASG